MRSDMKKVVTEQPRAGGRIKSPKGEKRQLRRCGFENLPIREKIRQKWWANEKGFTDRLGPLKHYLDKQVGRKWDDVYSEIAKNLPKTSMQNIHIHGHIREMVVRCALIVDGTPCYREGGWLSGRPIYARVLYVHPVTGLLCRTSN